MEFDSLFNEVMEMADQAIEDALASKFRLLLRDGSNLDIKAIFDAKLDASSRTESRPMFVAEEGALTVLNSRIDKSLVEGASVQTEIGERHIADVFYPEPNVSILILTIRGRSHHSGNFLK